MAKQQRDVPKRHKKLIHEPNWPNILGQTCFYLSVLNMQTHLFLFSTLSLSHFQHLLQPFNTSALWQRVPLNTRSKTQRGNHLSFSCFFVTNNPKKQWEHHKFCWFCFGSSAFMPLLRLEQMSRMTTEHWPLMASAESWYLVLYIHYPRSTPKVLFITLFLSVCNVHPFLP